MRPSMPPPVVAARVLFFVFYGLVALRAGVGILASAVGDDFSDVGRYFAGPFLGLLPLMAAIHLPRGGQGRRTLGLISAIGIILAGLSNIGRAEPVGLLYLIMGVACLVLLLVSSSRHFFRSTEPPGPFFHPGAPPAPHGPYGPQEPYGPYPPAPGPQSYGAAPGQPQAWPPQPGPYGPPGPPQYPAAPPQYGPDGGPWPHGPSAPPPGSSPGTPPGPPQGR